MSRKIARKLQARKQKIRNRLDKGSLREDLGAMLRPGNIHYELSERVNGMHYGGIGTIQMLVRQVGLAEAIDRHLSLFKLYNPYHESDHVLNMAYNILCGGDCLEDIERLRNDEVYLDALNAPRIPDPTTAGDFCRRFSNGHVEILQEVINRTRLKVWRQQEPEFFDEAVIDADGTVAPTCGECKEGMDMSYKGDWGYHPLIVSLANTQEPLYIYNRSGNRTSSYRAAGYIDRAVALCREAGFRKIRLRGDTDFSQTKHLDGWDAESTQFVFGISAMSNLVEIAESLPEQAWQALNRPPQYTIQTQPRHKPMNAKDHVVRQRGYKNIRLESEQVAEFDYQPTKCRKAYRIVALRKNLSIEKGELALFDDIRYFFYITNDRRASKAGIVHQANDRCNQENLIAQLKSGVHAMRLPVDGLVSNWAYMVMASLAWTLKAWWALLIPGGGRWKERRRKEKRKVLQMEFKKFRNYFLLLPCQIVKTGRKLVYRLLGWNGCLEIFFRAVAAFQRPLRC